MSSFEQPAQSRPRRSTPAPPPRSLLAVLAVLASVVIAGAAIPVHSSAAPPDAASGDVTTRWYVCTIGGRPCGRMLESTKTDASGVRTVETDLLLRFLRQGVQVESRVTSEMQTDADGALTFMEITQDLGERPMVTSWRFHEGGVRRTRSQGGRSETSILPLPESPWFTPDAAMARMMSDPSDVPRTLRVVDPSNGIEPVPITYRRVGTSVVEFEGRRVEGVRWEIRQKDAPLVVEVVDPQGRTLSSRTVLGPGLGALEIVRSSRERAIISARASAELLDAGAVRPAFETAVIRPDRADTLALRIKPRAGSLPVLVDAGAQRVRRDGDTLIVTVTPGRTSPCPEVRPEDLAATPIADHEDPAVRRFATRASRGAATAGETAERLRRAVHRHIDRKGLETAFASASDTVRNRRGDCTEHAVLLAAALRSKGIASRAVNGLIWIPAGGVRDGSYLWHMWTQAVVDGEWLDLDATLPADGPGFHAGHLAINTGDLSPASLNATGTGMLEVFGAIDITILGGDPDP